MKHTDVRKQLMARPGVKRAYDALADEFGTLDVLLKARQQARLTQQQVAERMGTTTSAVSRLEASLTSERHSPSIATLRKYARACGKKLVVRMR
jgi:predicted transcriptional regulator